MASANNTAAELTQEHAPPLKIVSARFNFKFRVDMGFKRHPEVSLAKGALMPVVERPQVMTTVDSLTAGLTSAPKPSDFNLCG